MLQGLQSNHWGCVYIIEDNGVYTLDYTYLPDVPDLTDEHIVNGIVTDNAPYVASQLQRRFCDKCVSTRTFKLSQADLDYIDSVPSYVPFDTFKRLVLSLGEDNLHKLRTYIPRWIQEKRSKHSVAYS